MDRIILLLLFLSSTVIHKRKGLEKNWLAERDLRQIYTYNVLSKIQADVYTGSVNFSASDKRRIVYYVRGGNLISFWRKLDLEQEEDDTDNLTLSLPFVSLLPWSLIAVSVSWRTGGRSFSYITRSVTPFLRVYAFQTEVWVVGLFRKLTPNARKGYHPHFYHCRLSTQPPFCPPPSPFPRAGNLR